VQARRGGGRRQGKGEQKTVRSADGLMTRRGNTRGRAQGDGLRQPELERPKRAGDTKNLSSFGSMPVE
jgi:hypothetical protein